ncbi:MAG: AAA family ATPase [archaeon GB-1867-035]|nr:AAA family ATPase [Candidatus Culexmicrobium profundum]
MTFIITVTGKGGTGKTLIASLIVKHLTRMFKDSSILVVDADSNTNLNCALGISFKKTLGDLREEFINPPDSSSGAKDLYFESMLYEEVLVESEYFDFIAMGRPEGPGCYCYVNHLLRHALDRLTKNYDFVVIDCEAGLEHLSRRTMRNIDVMLIVVDSSIRSIITAERIRELSKELELSVGNIYVVINRVNKHILPQLLEELLRRDFKIIGSIPEDPMVIDYDFKGKPLIDLPDNSLAVKSVGDILSRLYPLIKPMI